MSEKKIESLNKYAAKCHVMASARVYDSDKEVAESIMRIKKNKKQVGIKRMCTFAVKKA